MYNSFGRCYRSISGMKNIVKNSFIVLWNCGCRCAGLPWYHSGQNNTNRLRRKAPRGNHFEKDSNKKSRLYYTTWRCACLCVTILWGVFLRLFLDFCGFFVILGFFGNGLSSMSSGPGKSRILRPQLPRTGCMASEPWTWRDCADSRQAFAVGLSHHPPLACNCPK